MGAEGVGPRAPSPPPSPSAGRAAPLGVALPPLPALTACVEALLTGLGEDVTREGLRDTPKAGAVVAG